MYANFCCFDRQLKDPLQRRDVRVSGNETTILGVQWFSEGLQLASKY